MVKLRGGLVLAAVLLFGGMITGEGPPDVWAADGLKIGYVDAQKVLENSQLGKKARANLQEYVSSREKILEIDRQELREMEEDLIKQGPLLAEDARRVKQEDYQRKAERFQRRLLEMNREIQEKQVELVQNFRKKLEVVVQVIAEKDGYDFILDRDAETGPILYAGKNHNLTVQVAREMDMMKP